MKRVKQPPFDFGHEGDTIPASYRSGDSMRAWSKERSFEPDPKREKSKAKNGLTQWDLLTDACIEAEKDD